MKSQSVPVAPSMVLSMGGWMHVSLSPLLSDKGAPGAGCMYHSPILSDKKTKADIMQHMCK